jgi:hypothetical protein
MVSGFLEVGRKRRDYVLEARYKLNRGRFATRRRQISVGNDAREGQRRRREEREEPRRKREEEREDNAPTSGTADNRCKLAWQDLDVETTKDGNVLAGRVTEVDVRETDVTLRFLERERLSRRVLSVDGGNGVVELERGGASLFGLRHYSSEKSQHAETGRESTRERNLHVLSVT